MTESSTKDFGFLRVPDRDAQQAEDEDDDRLGDIGSPPSRDRSKPRRTARSGSITETTVDTGRMRKVVLETNSSSEDGSSPTTETNPSHSRSRTSLLDSVSLDAATDEVPGTNGEAGQANRKKKKKRSHKRKGGKSSDER
jgi:metal transporter CNNM